MNEREIYRIIFDHKQPPRLPKFGYVDYASTPGEHSLTYPQNGPDWFGVQWIVGPDGTQVVKNGFSITDDLENWREKITIPDVDSIDWKADAERQTKKWDRENHLQIVAAQSGHFERLYSIMGFEAALTAFYEFPDEVHEIFEEITKLKIGVIHRVKEYYNPDIFSPHDDWGMNRSMFFSPDIWREFLKPHVKRLVDECHACGMLYEQHSCGHISEVLGDLVEIGVDMAEVQSCNDFESFKKTYGNRMILKGCFNAQVLCAPNITPEVARKSVREMLQVCAAGGGYGGHSYGIPAETDEIRQVVLEEIDRFNREAYGYNGEE